MNLNDIHCGVKTRRPRKRIGRGPGSGHGKTAGRGHKGQRSRSGYSSSPLFEGGQMPLFRRVPKRGFTNRFAPAVVVINVGVLEEHFQNGQAVTPDALKAKTLVKGRYDLLKILGDGELTKNLTVAAHRFSATAKEKIEKAGGQIQLLPGKKPVVKNKQRTKGKDEGQG
jgi:large subunit ribosomal protein L15